MLSVLRKRFVKPALAAPDLLDRDHSLLAFNERVLDWAVRDDVPLLERLSHPTSMNFLKCVPSHTSRPTRPMTTRASSR
jgi:Polyphosphate kinase N-terminal domain